MALDQVRLDLKSKYPSDLVDALIDSYLEIKNNFFLQKHEPSELNGGKFCEACFRILQFETNNGVFIPIGSQIRNMINGFRNFGQVQATSTNESFRINIPRVLLSIYNIRNKRGVGHLGGKINPNKLDSTIIVSAADWVLAELFRIHYSCSSDKAQNIVDSIIVFDYPYIYESDNLVRILIPQLKYEDQILLLLYKKFPLTYAKDELIEIIEVVNTYRFSGILSNLHKRRYIEFDKAGNCKLLPPGANYINQTLPIWTEKYL